MQLVGKVYARFDADGDHAFHQYGSKGIPFLEGQVRDKSLSSQEKMEKAQALLTQRYGKFFSG